ncbi:PDZ domain-containing protein [Sorangium sp. So ce854]|uniref:PDZ domain-containing protein n=1 Tax=Sorangium sp. So ce854 TaxID=3133322 RepID=UPI003F5FDFF6
MQGGQQRAQPVRASGASGWARRLSGVLTPLLPLAVVACRGECSRAEATPQPQGTEAAQRRVDAPARPASPAQAATAERRPRPAPATRSVAAPWYLTLQPTSGAGVRIASMDVRSFAAPLLEPGDVILAVDGRPVHATEELEGYLGASAPGEMVVLTVLRSETTINYAMLQVPNGQAPPPSAAGATGPAGPAGGG